MLRKMPSLILAGIMILPVISSCGGGKADTPDYTTAENTSVESETTADEEYDYPSEGFGGYEFRFLNMESQYGCYVSLDFEEQTGEALDDSVFLRNRKIEEKLDIKISVETFPEIGWWTAQAGICEQLMKAVMAGDDAYDAAYLPVYFKHDIVHGGYLMNLRSIPELKLDEPYWDNVINDSLQYNDSLIIASSPLHMMSFDLSWVLLFNQRLFDDLGFEYPYECVLDGKWTLDRFAEYVTASPDLNGDSSYAYADNGSCRYAIAGHSDSVKGFIYSSDYKMTAFDEKGELAVNVGGEKLHTIVDKLIAILNDSNGQLYYENEGGHSVFNPGRAVFSTIELKSVIGKRDVEDPFGMVPFPKYDEQQKDYQTMMNSAVCFLTVPVTQTDTERAGVILDALTYESYKEVLPVYYDVTLEQKGLRNNESIEMLDIVRNTRGAEFVDVFGITTDYFYKIKEMVMKRENTLASATEKNIKKIEANLETVKEAFAGA